MNNLELQTKVKGLLEKFKRKLRDKWIGSTKQKDSYLTKKGLSKLVSGVVFELLKICIIISITFVEIEQEVF